MADLINKDVLGARIEDPEEEVCTMHPLGRGL